MFKNVLTYRNVTNFTILINLILQHILVKNGKSVYFLFYTNCFRFLTVIVFQYNNNLSRIPLFYDCCFMSSYTIHFSSSRYLGVFLTMFHLYCSSTTDGSRPLSLYSRLISVRNFLKQCLTVF